VEAYWRYRSWTVPITVVIAVLAGLIVFATSGTSTASTTLFLTDPRGAPVFREGSSTPTDLDRFARQRAEFADSARVHQAVVDSIDDARDALLASGPTTSGEELPAAETVESVDDAVTTRTTTSSDVRIECTAEDDGRALLLCDETVTAYLTLTEADTRERGDSTVEALLAERNRLIDEASGRNTIDQIDLRIAEVRSEVALLGDGVEFVEPAEVNEDSRVLPALQFTIAGLLFAAFALAILAWFRAGRRPLVGSSAEATATLDAPLLGEITVAPTSRFDPAAPPGAAYQLIATSLGAVHGDGVILAATATPSATAAETFARVAVSAAREGRRVLIVDANLHERSISKLFGFDRADGGFIEMVAGLATLDDVRRTVGVGGEASLDLVVGGRSVDDPAGLFRSQSARAVTEMLRRRYQLVLIDAPPLIDHAEGSALAGETDGVVLVVDRGADTSDLEIVRQRLHVLRTELLGVVFDHRDHGG